jgi:hypothetical protein
MPHYNITFCMLSNLCKTKVEVAAAAAGVAPAAVGVAAAVGVVAATVAVAVVAVAAAVEVVHNFCVGCNLLFQWRQNFGRETRMLQLLLLSCTRQRKQTMSLAL